MPDSDTPLRVSLHQTGGGTAERASHERRPFHSPAPTELVLDRDATIEAIAGLWGLAPAEPSGWRLDRFGADLATSVEVLAGVVFAPHRGLVSGAPGLEIRVLPIVSDTHSQPALVCVSGLGGPMRCHGIDDLAGSLPDPWGSSPETLLNALEYLLAVAASIIDGAAAAPAPPASAPAAGPARTPTQPIG